MTVYGKTTSLPTPPRIEAKKPRIREIEHGGQTFSLPSVTTIIDGAVANPVLADWRVNTACEDIVNQARGLYESVVNSPLTADQFELSLYRRLGSSWADKRIADREAQAGTRVHDLIEWQLRGELGQAQGPMPDHISDSTRNAFDSWLAWRQTVNLKPMILEAEVYSIDLMASGRFDLYAEVDGVARILDWKPLKNRKYPPYHTYRIQLGGYSLLAKERGIAPIEGAMCVRLSKSGVEYDATAYGLEDLSEFEEQFRIARKLYRFLKGM